MSKTLKTTKKESTRPIVQLPFTIMHTDSEQFQKIAQGLNFVSCIEQSVPGVEVKIYKLTTDEATLCVTHTSRFGRKPVLYRFGLSTASDGVRHSDGRKYKATFAEFIDQLRQDHIAPEVTSSTSSEDDASSEHNVSE